MSDFLTFCRFHGVVIDRLPEIGTWRRYKTEDKPGHRNGAVKFMGDHGFVQNHATMTEVASWRADVAPGAAIARDMDAVRRQRQRDAARRSEAICEARNFWADSRPLSRPHPYVERKGLTPLGCAGLRMNDGLLVVPVLIDDGMVSLQTITAAGEKRFWAGAPVKAGAYILARKHAALKCFVEGLATGLAIYQSLPRATVVVAFDCGNLMPVVQRLRPTGSVVICADNDHGTQARRGVNPGLEKANEVAEHLGCGVAYPSGLEGTDWADALKEWGANATRRIEREVLAGARFVMG
jgi:putative DNA primase/helicase